MENIKNPTRFIVLLMVLATIGPIALNMPLPILPLLTREFNTTPEMAQLTLTLYLLGMGFSQIIMGPLGDRYGRRPVILWGMALGALCALLASYATSIEMLIILRFLQAIGVMGGVVLGRAIIRDRYPQEKAASMMGYVTMGTMVGPLVTPYLGGVLTQSSGWQSVFFVIVVLTILATLFAYFDLVETQNKSMATKGFKALGLEITALFKVKRFWLFCLTGAFATVSFFAITGGVPYITVTLLGKSPADFGAWFAITAVGYGAGNYCSGRYAVSHGLMKLMGFGLISGTFGAFLFLLFIIFNAITEIWVLFLPFLFTTFGCGLILPSSMAGAISVNPSVAGSAAGLNGFSVMALGAVASQLAGTFVAQYGSSLPLALIIGFSFILSFINYRALKHG